MTVLFSLALMLGLFVEERLPAKGYACLTVRYKGIVYKAEKLERTRLTGAVSLRLPPPFDPVGALLGQPPEGRLVQLGGYDSVEDSNSCACPPVASAYGRCVDN